MIKIRKARYATICDGCQSPCHWLIVTGKKHYLHLCKQCYHELVRSICASSDIMNWRDTNG